jgi:hypothetical protein
VLFSHFTDEIDRHGSPSSFNPPTCLKFALLHSPIDALIFVTHEPLHYGSFFKDNIRDLTAGWISNLFLRIENPLASFPAPHNWP